MLPSFANGLGSSFSVALLGRLEEWIDRTVFPSETSEMLVLAFVAVAAVAVVDVLVES